MSQQTDCLRAIAALHIHILFNHIRYKKKNTRCGHPNDLWELPTDICTVDEIITAFHQCRGPYIWCRWCSRAGRCCGWTGRESTDLIRYTDVQMMYVNKKAQLMCCIVQARHSNRNISGGHIIVPFAHLSNWLGAHDSSAFQLSGQTCQ